MNAKFSEHKQYLKIKLEGYRSRVLGIERSRNWYLPVRPNSTDTQAWYTGWDLADSDIPKIQNKYPS